MFYWYLCIYLFCNTTCYSQSCRFSWELWTPTMGKKNNPTRTFVLFLTMLLCLYDYEVEHGNDDMWVVLGWVLAFILLQSPRKQHEWMKLGCNKIKSTPLCFKKVILQYVYKSTQAGMSHKTLRENMHPSEPPSDVWGCCWVESHPHLCPDTNVHVE